MKYIIPSLLLLFTCLFSTAQNKNASVDGVSGATLEWNKQKELKNISKDNGKLHIAYPFSGSVFPSDFSPASFIWKSAEAKNSKWNISFKVKGTNIQRETDTCYFKPDIELWQKLKELSEQKQIVFSVKDENSKEKASIEFSFSADAVEAPIFYRAVPLPFRHANTYRDQLEWYLGDVTTNQKRLMLNNMPVCANCHSFSKDGSTFAMDVDYANDKGNYTITPVEEKSCITVDNIVSWSDYKREDGMKTFGLLAQLSPDGKHAISTIKDQSIFVPVDKSFWYSQLFFPIRGILVTYDIEKKTFSPLQGASDENYVQSSPTWEPNMKEIIFARSKCETLEGLDGSENVISDLKYAADYVNREKDFKFDLYRVPWNNGKGGKAVPIPGASHNNKSNYFAKYSPDGKWIVFCQAENFMLLQPDSKLYIMPANGKSEPRLMDCNRGEMNSWHSFSPNGKWMVFSSKHFGPYTQLFLTHIDENGNDTPPIWLEQLTVDKKAANIPEFVNTDYNNWLGIEDGFTKSQKYMADIVDASLNVGNFDVAHEFADEEIKKNPDNYYGYYVKARALIKTAPTASNPEEHARKINYNFKKCIELLNKEIENNKADAETYSHLAASYYFTRQITKALEYGNKALELDPDNFLVWEAFAGIHFERKNYPKTIEANMKLFELTKVPTYANKCAQIKLMSGSVEDAIKYATMAYEADNCNDWTLEILGNCYVTLNDFETAEKYYNDLISCRPTEAISFYNRGKFFFSIKNYDRALDDLTESVRIDKNYWMARYLRAMVYLEQKQYAPAVEDLDVAIEANETNSELWFLKSKCQLHLEDYEKAKVNAEKAKELIYAAKTFGRDSFKNLFDINKIIKECEAKLN